MTELEIAYYKDLKKYGEDYFTKPFYAVTTNKNGKKNNYGGTRRHFDNRYEIENIVSFVKITSEEHLRLLRSSLGLNVFNAKWEAHNNKFKQRQVDYKYLTSKF